MQTRIIIKLIFYFNWALAGYCNWTFWRFFLWCKWTAGDIFFYNLIYCRIFLRKKEEKSNNHFSIFVTEHGFNKIFFFETCNRLLHTVKMGFHPSKVTTSKPWCFLTWILSSGVHKGGHLLWRSRWWKLSFFRRTILQQNNDF